ncbi:related to mrpl24-mitochondrial ribosomal large subunit [Ceraceosorus bombacis]|uniref:Large ribosomal subunit protein bL28m n=1 Tax=Ceraceosorus bombacis TaxID=401625 RepID=A0A0N7L8R3_9BASI|nr:related to mrpl24-mitochondrial ribosomal large subunit [Ceraceosorus bombacis]
MFPTLRLFSRTTYQGSRGSGPGRSGKTTFRSSPSSRATEVEAQQAGRILKRSQRGLYHGSLIQSGNNVPNSRQKTRRTWLPNVQSRNNLWSEVLQRHISTRISTRAMRTIEKYGGLDAYVANTKDALLGDFGRRLREEMGARVMAIWTSQGNAGIPSGKINFKSASRSRKDAARTTKELKTVHGKLGFMEQRALARSSSPLVNAQSLAERARLLGLARMPPKAAQGQTRLAAEQDIASEARVDNARADAAKEL